MLLSILGITQNVRIKHVFSVNKSKYKIKLFAMVMKRKNTWRKFPVPVNMCRSRLTLWILKKNDMSSETVSRSALTSEQPLGLTSTCWQVWISFPISDSSSLFLLIRLLRLESRACCGKKKKHTDVRTTEREWGMKRENGLDVRSSVAEEDKERNSFFFYPSTL